MSRSVEASLAMVGKVRRSLRHRRNRKRNRSHHADEHRRVDDETRAEFHSSSRMLLCLKNASSDHQSMPFAQAVDRLIGDPTEVGGRIARHGAKHRNDRSGAVAHHEPIASFASLTHRRERMSSISSIRNFGGDRAAAVRRGRRPAEEARPAALLGQVGHRAEALHAPDVRSAILSLTRSS